MKLFVNVQLLFPAAPPRMFEIAFKMFDLNGDGDVEYSEFDKVMKCLCMLFKIIDSTFNAAPDFCTFLFN